MCSSLLTQGRAANELLAKMAEVTDLPLRVGRWHAATPI